jgi:DNA-binding CsgD family transcriptional regulator
MSGIKPQAMADFYRALHSRGENTDTLAANLGVAGSTVRKLLGHLSGRHGPTWRALLAALTPRERELLAHVEQCSAWNNRRAARNRPRWTPAKAVMLSPVPSAQRDTDTGSRGGQKEAAKSSLVTKAAQLTAA